MSSVDVSSVNVSGLVEYYRSKNAVPNSLVYLENGMREQLCDLLGVSGVSGGAEYFTGGSCVGGYDTLQDYGNSMFSKAKETLIRNIADDVFSALKSSGVKNAKTAPIGDVVASLAKLLPPRAHGARKFGKDFNKSSESQRKVCHALANSLNRHYGGSIIDMSASEADMCNKVAEVMYSLFTGLHTEFMTVAGDVMRVMNNMQIVMNYIKAAYGKQKELIESTADVSLREQSANTDAVYKQIVAEYERQMAVLANLINVTVGPTGKSLIASLEENRDFAGLVKDIKAQVGTSAFGDKLAFLLAGVSSVAHSAELVDKALKKIGMSVQEFKSAKNASDLRLKVMNSMMKGHPSSKQLDDMVRAAQVIYNNSYDHDAVSKALSKSGKGEDDSDSDNEVQGGADDELPAYWAKKSLSKKIENKDKYRKLILNDFRRLLKSHYQGIMDSANSIAHHIGTTVPLSDDLDHFVRVFSNLPSLDEENLHVALSGYPKDSRSREKREQFFNNYEIVINTLEPLSKGPQGQVFKSLQSSLKGMLKSIDDFSDKMVKALTEIHVDSPDEIAASLRKTSSLFYGSAENDSFGSGSWVAFDKVKMELQYFYSIANIKTNIARSADDLKSYASDYEQILGEEAGWLINHIRAEFKLLLELSDITAGAARVPLSAEVEALAGAAAVARANTVWTHLRALHGVNAADAAVAHKNLKALWERQMNAKVNMVKVAQAVDLYLKSFTDGISRNPDSVQSVVKMLDQVELVAKWFNDKSGDNLATLFDVFPCGADIAGSGVESVQTGDFMDSKDSVVAVDGQIRGLSDRHYYHLVEEKCAAGTKMPGNPFMGRPLSGDFTTEKQLGGIFMLSERVVKSMRALENILSAFSSVGSKFGDLDPAAHTFMNPGQIFKAMCDYLTASAFASNFDPTSANRTAVIYRGKVTQQQTGDVAGTNVNIPSTTNQTQFRDAIAAGTLIAANDVALAANNTLNGGTPAVAPPSVGEFGILSGVAATHNDAAAANRKDTSLAMAAIPSDTNDALLAGNYWNYHSISKREPVRLDAAGWRDECYDTDFLFLMTVKSIVAKVFTVVDAYRLFHRPTTGFGSHYSLNPLRTILGGNEDGVEGGALNKVPVIPEALELYLRLPLLAEWYREKFNFSKIDTSGDENAWKLSLVPSIDGVWSGFVNLMFDKADFVTQGNYTETQAQALISEMNQIWKLYKNKYPKATVRQIINAYVLEMNRIFGFVKAKEIKKYLEQRRDYLKDNSDSSREDFLDYDILNANDQFGSRPAPSDKFVSVSMKAAARKERESVALLKTIDELRRKMDADFISVTSQSGDATFTFIDTLRNYKNEMANAKNDTEEYQVVLRMMQGASKSVNLGTEKLIMVHEMIAAPLATLYATYKVIARYNALLHGCSLPNLIRWNEVRVNGDPTGLDVGTARDVVVNNTDVLRFYKDFLNKVAYRERSSQVNGRDTVHLALFGRMLTGNVDTAVLAADNCGYVTVGGGAPVANAGLAVDNLNATALCQDLLAAILDLCSNPNKLVTCSVGASGHINVDVGALEDLCKSTLSQIKENAKKLRQMFPPSHTDLVDKYEDRNTIGSTRWLEENLINVLLEDRDKCGLPRGHTEHLLPTLNQLFKNGTATTGVITADSLFGSMDLALQGLVYYQQVAGANSLLRRSVRNDFLTFPFSVIPMKKPADSQAEKDLISLCAGTANFANVNQRNLLPNLTWASYVHFEANDKSTLNKWKINAENNHKSLMLAFNNILRMYLYTNCEDGTNKFYAPLIESFAYGAASLEVAQSKAFPDVGGVSAGGGNVNNNADYHRPLAADGPLGVPEAETIVFASNALAIRGLLTTVQQIGTSQKKKFTFETFAEIPEHLKERMRVNLPFFSKMLQNLADRAALLKNIVNNTALSKNLEHTASGSNIQHHVAEVSSALSTTAKTTEVSATYYNGMLNKLNNLALDLKKCADNVYKELQDKVPYFLETSKDFLVDYRQRVGGMPVMPASSILVPLRCLERKTGEWTVSDESHVMMPVKENGSAAYRFNYATRLLLARNDVDVQLDHMPGAKELYNAYATSASKTVVLSPQEYADSIKNMVKLLKFLADGAVYGRLYDRPDRNLNNVANMYSTHNVFGAVGWAQETAVLRRANAAIVAGGTWKKQLLAMDDDQIAQVTNRGAGGNNDRNTAITAAWNLRNGSHTALVKNNPAGGDTDVNRFKNNLSCLALQADEDNAMLSGLLELTENTNVRSSKDRLGESLGAEISGAQNNDRKRLTVQNILEYNIVPINVHAFMREVPFVNLLNYSYTFDRMVHDFVLPTYVSRNRAGINADNLMISASAPVASTRELMVKLLVHPYANLGNEGLQYFALLASLFNGNDDLKLGRPRYLSDQLWHKVLLTSSAQLVAGQDMFNSTGSNYPTDLRSLEAGPAAYEAMRAVVRYSAPKTDRSQSLHNIGQGLITGSRLLTAFVGTAAGINRATAGAAVALYLNNLGEPRPATLAAAYNDFDNAAINRALNDNNPWGGGLLLTQVETLIPEAADARTSIVALTAIHIAVNANVAGHYQAQDALTRPIGAAAGTTQMWQLMYNGGGPRADCAAVTAAAAAGNAMIGAGLGQLATNYDTVFQRLNAGAATANLLPALKTRYNAAVAAMRDVTISMAAAALGGALAAGAAALDSLIIDLESKQSGAAAFVALPAPFNARPVVVNNAMLVGTYHNLAFFVDSFPNHTDNTRNAMKMVLGLALHGATNAQVLAALNSVIASVAYRSMDFFDQAFIQIMQMRAAGAAPAAAAGAANEAAELLLISFCQHASSGLREIAELVDHVRDTYSGNARNMSASRRAASAYFMLPADPVATPGLKVMRPNSNGVWQEARMSSAGAAHTGQQMRTPDVLYCAELGKMRFDTKLVRNLTWFAQLQRVMRVVLVNHLSWLNTPVVRGLKIADPKITEFNANEGFDNRDFTGELYEAV